MKVPEIPQPRYARGCLPTKQPASHAQHAFACIGHCEANPFKPAAAKVHLPHRPVDPLLTQLQTPS